MSLTNGFGIKLDFELMSFDKVNKEVLAYAKQLSKSGNIKLGMDTSELSKLKETFTKLSQTKITVFDQGQYTQVQSLKNSMGELLKITEKFNNSEATPLSTTYSVSGSKGLENQKALYKELSNLQKTEYSLKQQMLTADKGQYTELSRQLEVTKQIKSLTGKAINNTGSSDETSNNKLLRERIDLINSLKIAEQKIGDNQALKQEQAIIKAKEEAYQQALKLNNAELKMSEAYAKEQQQVELLKKNKIELLNIQKQTLTRQYGNKVDTSNIDNSISKIKSMNNISMSKLKDEFRSIDTSIKQTTENAKTGTTTLSKIGTALGNVGVYLSVATAIREIVKLFQQASEYTLQIDKNLTNIQMITGKSKSEVAGITDEYKALGAELHTTNAEMLSGSEEVLRAGYSQADATKIMSASVLGSKVSGQDLKTTTEQMIAIKNSFDLSGDSMEHVVDIISKMDNVSATSFAEISDAIQRTAFSAQQAGTPLENLVAYITTVSEKTRKPAETIGESFKTIYARYSSIKLGNLDDDGKSINDTEKALGRIGIKIRDGKDSFRDFDVVLQEFMDKVKSGSVSQVDYLASVQALAGTRQKETLLSLVENMDTLKTHQEQLTESTGSAKAMFDNAYDGSLDAKVNDLKRSFEGLYEKILNSKALGVAINGFSALISNLPTIIGLATVALIAFKGVAIQTFLITKSSAIAGFIADLITVTAGETALTVATVGLNEVMLILKGLFLANPFGIALMGVTAFIGGMIALSSAMDTTKDKIDSLNESSDNFKDIASQEALVTQYKTLQATINDTKTPIEQVTQAKKDLLEVQKQLATQLPNLIDGYDKEGNALVKNLNSVEAKLTENKAGAIKEAQQNYTKVMESMNQVQVTDPNRGLSYLNKDSSDLAQYVKLLEKTSQMTDKESEKFTEVKNNLNELNKAVIAINANGGDVSQMKVFDFATNKMVDATTYIKENTVATDANGNAQTSLATDISSTGDSATTTATKMKTLTDSFSASTSTIGTLKDALEEFSKNGFLSADTMGSIFDTGDTELISLLGDSNTFMEKGNAILGERKTLQEQQRDEVIKNAMAEQGLVDSNGNAYSTDVANKTDAENAKANVSVQLLNALADSTGKSVDELAGQYGVDLANKTDSENAKGTVVEQLLNDLASATGKTVDELAKQYGVDAENFANAQNSKALSAFQMKDTQTMVDSSQFLDEDAMMKEVERIKNGGSISGVTKSSYNPVKAGYSPVSVGDIADSSSGSGSADKAKEDVANLESLVDRYYRLDNVISALTNTIDKYENAKKNAHGQEYVNAINNEIEAYKNKQKAIKSNIDELAKERWEKRVQLSNAGFDFDADWNINGNYASKLEQLTNSANALSGDAKENAINAVKELSDATKRYAELVFNEIPSAEKEWQELSDTIQETYKSMADEIASKEKEVSDVISYYAEKNVKTKQDALDRQIEAVNKAYDNEDKSASLNSKKTELAELKSEMDKFEFATDKVGINKFKSLQEQYKTLEDEMNQTIRDTQKETTLDNLNKEKDALSTALEDYLKPENINSIIESGLKSGMVDIMGQVVSLQSANATMLKETEVGYTNVASQTKIWADSLSSIIAMYPQLNAITSTLGYNIDRTVPTSISGASANITNLMSNPTAGAISISMPLTIQGSVNEDVMPKLLKAIDTATTKVKVEINNALGNR